MERNTKKTAEKNSKNSTSKTKLKKIHNNKFGENDDKKIKDKYKKVEKETKNKENKKATNKNDKTTKNIETDKMTRKNDKSSKENDNIKNDKVTKNTGNEKIEKQSKKYSKKSVWKTNMDNKNAIVSQTNIILANLSHKETKESIKAVFSKYGEIDGINFVKNKDNQFKGKALVIYKSKYDKGIFSEEITMSNKIIKVIRESIKIEKETYKSQRRVFLNHMNKDYKIIDIRNIIKKYPKLKIKDIRIKNEGTKMRNAGYCFIEFKSDEQAKWFVDNFNDIRIHFGDKSRVEYSNEKISENKEAQ
ncbi:hypothetical protein BDAP_001978 [Binucleata daphniae]